MKKNGITNTGYLVLMDIYNAIPKDWINLLIGNVHLKTERNRKYVAHDEKSKFSLFRPQIPYVSSRNVVAFLAEKIFLTLQKIKKPLPHYVSPQTPRINANHTFS